MSGNKLFVSQNILLENSFLNGGILVNEEGKISKIIKHEDLEDYYSQGAEVIQLNRIFLIVVSIVYILTKILQGD